MSYTRQTRSSARASARLLVETTSKNLSKIQKPAKNSVKNAAKNSVKSSSKKVKRTFKEQEQKLLEQYPVPKDLSLPESFITAHNTDFIKGLNYVLKKDPSLYPLAISSPFAPFLKEAPISNSDQEHFEHLCRSVISQQVSGSAARSIFLKVTQIYCDDGKFPTPPQLLETPDIDLRTAGLSARKTEYCKEIASSFVKNQVSDRFFKSGTDQEIMDELVKIKGIGFWSAKMFMAFSLNRLDVFAADDLGVARGISRYLTTRPHLLQEIKETVDISNYKKKSKFQDSKKRDWKIIHDLYVEAIAEMFAPYKTIFMLILWRASATNIDVLQSST